MVWSLGSVAELASDHSQPPAGNVFRYQEISLQELGIGHHNPTRIGLVHIRKRRNSGFIAILA